LFTSPPLEKGGEGGFETLENLPNGLKELDFSPAFSGVKTGVQQVRDPRKHWIPAGVYPDENRGRNDVKKGQIDFSQFPLPKGNPLFSPLPLSMGEGEGGGGQDEDLLVPPPLHPLPLRGGERRFPEGYVFSIIKSFIMMKEQDL
jgi:hypothetical protein